MSTCFVVDVLTLEAYTLAAGLVESTSWFPLKGHLTLNHGAENCCYTALCEFELSSKWNFWPHPAERCYTTC